MHLQTLGYRKALNTLLDEAHSFSEWSIRRQCDERIALSEIFPTLDLAAQNAYR